MVTAFRCCNVRLEKWTKDMKEFYLKASEAPGTRIIPNKGDGVEQAVYTPEYRALKESGEANVFEKSGLSQKEFEALDTEDFMMLQFGPTKKYSEFADLSGERKAAESAERDRQSAARSQAQRASPWWA